MTTRSKRNLKKLSNNRDPLHPKCAFNHDKVFIKYPKEDTICPTCDVKKLYGGPLE